RIRQNRVGISMPKARLASVVATFALLSGAAFAVDLQSYPTGTNAYSWEGFYVGVNTGYQGGSIHHNPARPTGVAGGVQAGYNAQYSQFVFGGEADLQLSGANDTFAPWKFSNPWFGTLRARAGLAINSVMFYGTVGVAYGSLKTQNTLIGLSEAHTGTGWAAGAGAEIALIGNWTARAE